jgi:tetratricopeptide (TPR) repeat protein
LIAVDRLADHLILAEFHERAGALELAKAARVRAAATDPELAGAANAVAWRWLMPKRVARLRDSWRLVQPALLLARKAVELDPGNPAYRNTLGLALYRSGRYAEARAMFEQSRALRMGRLDAWDLFPLAICQQRLGDRVAALESFRKGVAWFQANGTTVEGDVSQLTELELEARKLLEPPG